MLRNIWLQRSAGLLLAAPLLLVLGCLDPDRSVSSGDGAGTERRGIDEGVEGHVTDSGGKPLADVAVQPRSLDQPTTAIPELMVISEQDGRYRWTLQPGEYELTFSVEGYQAATRRVTVRSREVSRLDVTLEPAP